MSVTPLRKRTAPRRRSATNADSPARAAAPRQPQPASGRFSQIGLYGYILRTSGRAQLLLALLSVLICGLDLVPLELQRRIINDAIGAHALSPLLWLCGAYAGVALAQGVSKLVWNVYRNSVGEATSRRLRSDTFAAALRHREPDAVTKEGIGVSIILSEADPVGSFVATSVTEPVLHGGVLLSVFAYLIWLQPWMALVALLLFVPQCLFVPLVQNTINRRTEARIQTMRELSADIIGETADGVLERETRSYQQRVGRIYSLNMQIYRRKYAMNFLINLLYHLGTIGILLVGGWFVMRRQMQIGTVVAFISGLTKVNTPWNDLVTFFRDMTNARVKYQLIAKVLDERDAGAAAPVSVH
jgi:ABC-type bacteriocin/lantibiotic exporter with double-glycine peptidase domain